MSRADLSEAKVVEGRLDLSGRSLTSLRGIGVRDDLRVLVVNDNELTSFSGLGHQPALETIIANGNRHLMSLNGLPDLEALSVLEIAETPISQRHNYRVMTLASVGKQLQMLDGVELTRDDESKADIVRTREPQALYLDEPVEIGDPDDDGKSETVTFRRCVVTEHERFILPFAYNQAVLKDLNAHGPLPVIDKWSSEKDIASAITDMRRRVEGLARMVREMGDNASVYGAE